MQRAQSSRRVAGPGRDGSGRSEKDRSGSPSLARVVLAELATLRGRVLGECAACGHDVYVERNHTWSRGRIAHVRCPVSFRSPAPGAASLVRARIAPAR